MYELVVVTEENIHKLLPQLFELQECLVEPSRVNGAQIMQTAADARNHFIAFFCEGRVVAMGVASVLVHPVATEGYVNNVVVHPHFQRRGLATKVMGELERWATEQGCTRMRLTSKRSGAQKVYLHLGYEQRESAVFTKNL